MNNRAKYKAIRTTVVLLKFVPSWNEVVFLVHICWVLFWNGQKFMEELGWNGRFLIWEMVCDDLWTCDLLLISSASPDHKISLLCAFWQQQKRAKEIQEGRRTDDTWHEILHAWNNKVRNACRKNTSASWKEQSLASYEIGYLHCKFAL